MKYRIKDSDRVTPGFGAENAITTKYKGRAVPLKPYPGFPDRFWIDGPYYPKWYILKEDLVPVSKKLIIFLED